MNEIYWITRLDCIKVLLGIALIISTAVLATAIIMLWVDYDETLMENEPKRKMLRTSRLVVIISSLLLTFIPDSKTALMILGVGTTIDYIKENETIKDLPDKCVKALDAWADSIVGEED